VAAGVPHVVAHAGSPVRRQAGETVLVTRRGSGVAARRCRSRSSGRGVVATAAGAAKCARAKDLGAPTSSTTPRRLGEGVRESHRQARRGHRGGAHRPGHVGGQREVAGRGGRLVTCGATSGFEAKFRPARALLQELSFSAPRWEAAARSSRARAHQGRPPAPVVDRVMPLATCARRHRVMEDREQFGKIVLVP